MSRKIRLLLILLLVIPVFGFAENYQAGVDYKIIDVPNGTLNASGNKVSVVEFFNPGCPWCYKLDPAIETWLNNKPGYVNFSRVPLAFESGWSAYQKAYYIAVAVDKQRIIIPALFKAIHVENKNLASQADLQRFFSHYGVKAKLFNQLYNSPSIDLQLSNASALMSAYKVYEIPTIIIDGKYVVSASMAKGDDQHLMNTMKYLIRKAHN